MDCKRTLNVADIEFTFSCQFDAAADVEMELHADPVEHLAETYLIRADVRGPTEAEFDLFCFSISWAVPLIDMHGLYFGGNPGPELSRLPFWKIDKQICANTGVPYIGLIHRNGDNRAAFGLLDQLTETYLSAELSEATRCYHFQVQKPASKDGTTGSIRVKGQWTEYLFVSKARRAWPDILRNYVHLTDQITALSKMPVPEHAYDPVFCSWTAIHHDVSHDWIMRNAAIAADLGFKTWITDDGWFIPDGQFANYSRTGDWEPWEEKFPDFPAHVRAVQNLGLRYVLWVSPFMVGTQSQAAKRYAHLLTTGQELLRFDNLAPWHPETQTLIADLLERLVSSYHLDGLKIDFIDSVLVQGNHANGSAGTSVGKSIFTTLKYAIDRVLALNPGLLVEFRNSYTNLASRSYANVYRSSDVPINFTMNRWQAIMLRLLTPDRAVQLDPALWHQDETDENVAVHLINCLMSVPMVSIELDRYPQSHLDLIRYWIGFYTAHRDTIIHGVFKPTLCPEHVPVIEFESAAESIIALYEDVPIKSDSRKPKVWVLNASTKPYVEFAAGNWASDYTAILRDKFGRTVSEFAAQIPATRLNIEVGGSAELTRR